MNTPRRPSALAVVAVSSPSGLKLNVEGERDMAEVIPFRNDKSDGDWGVNPADEGVGDAGGK